MKKPIIHRQTQLKASFYNLGMVFLETIIYSGHEHFAMIKLTENDQIDIDGNKR